MNVLSVEAAIQRLAAGHFEGRVDVNDDPKLRCWYCRLAYCEVEAAGIGPVHRQCLSQVREMTGAEALAYVGFRKGLASDEKFWLELVRRFWPVTGTSEPPESASFSELRRALSPGIERGATIDAELVEELLDPR